MHNFNLDNPATEVARITLNRPDARNALSSALRVELVDALDALAADDTVRAVILTGAGDTFCAGFDLKELSSGDAAKIFADAGRYHAKVHGFPKPLIAAVNGPALAGGMDLALMCDIRIAAPAATFGQPQVKMGVPAAYDLVRSVCGDATARLLCLTGRRLSAQEALALGIVSEVTDDLSNRAIALASEIAVAKASGAMKARMIAAQPKLFDDRG